jgi:hypothetical protein
MILTMNLILAFLLDFLYDLFADWEMYIRNVFKNGSEVSWYYRYIFVSLEHE